MRAQSQGTANMEEDRLGLNLQRNKDGLLECRGRLPSMGEWGSLWLKSDRRIGSHALDALQRKPSGSATGASVFGQLLLQLHPLVYCHFREERDQVLSK